MKIKIDFVTNSSSASFLLYAEAKYKTNGETKTIERWGQDLTTWDIIKLIEGELQRRDPNLFHTEVILDIKVEDIFGDGWGGDYNFAGQGYRYFGNKDLLETVITKNNVPLEYMNGRLYCPEDWINECEQEIIQEKYKVDDDGNFAMPEQNDELNI